MWRFVRDWLRGPRVAAELPLRMRMPAPLALRENALRPGRNLSRQREYPRLLPPDTDAPEHDPLRGWWNATPAPRAAPPAPERAAADAAARSVASIGSADPPAADPPATNPPATNRPPANPPVTQSPPADSPPGATIDQALYEELTGVLRDPGVELPRMPGVAQRALALLRSPALRYTRLAQLVAQDPALTAQVLRVVNSPLYRGVNTFTRLDHVFARLGQRGLDSLFTALSMRGLMIRTGGACRSLGEQLWQRALAAAETAAALGPLVQRDAEQMFLIGLLHDIGALAILRIVHDYQRQHARRLPRAVFDRVVEAWHGPIGLRLADEWELPSPLPEIIAGHHAEPEPGDALAVERLVVQFADAVCDQLGYGGRQVSRELLELPCAQRLGLSPDLRTCELLEGLPPRIEQRLAAL